MYLCIMSGVNTFLPSRRLRKKPLVKGRNCEGWDHSIPSGVEGSNACSFMISRKEDSFEDYNTERDK